MANGSPKSTWREMTIQALQRQLQRFEIEVRRLKAILGRIAADHDDEVADELAQQLNSSPPREPMAFEIERELAFADSAIEPLDTVLASSASANDLSTRTANDATPDLASLKPHDKTVPVGTDWNTTVEASIAEIANQPVFAAANNSWLRRLALRAKMTPLFCSSLLHSAIVLLLLFGVTQTVAKFESHKLTLVTTPLKIEEDIPVISGDLGAEPVQLTSAEMQAPAASSGGVDVADVITADFTAVEGDGGAKPISTFSQVDALPSDLGTLISGSDIKNNGDGIGTGRGDSGKTGTGGKGGSGRRGGNGQGGGPNSTVFFGTKSKGDRFVFVIDNSSSMKGGRLDLARTELLRTVESLSPKQSFYVIFVSDQTYPMFYPQPELDLVPATPANIRRLTEWLPKAILASGKNRQLIKAMDMAAALRPHAIYLLWDGDLKYSDAVRLDVMTHLTAPGQWNFTVHTIGFNITSADSQQNLTAIAQAHGGVFRRVDVPVTPNR